MLDGWSEIQNAVAAIVAGYLLGALPFAHLGGRINGVDVFSTGNTLAGTANVFWNVGRRAGTLVFVGDVAKGAAAVIVAGLLDVSPPIVLLAGAAAILGHWKSVFTSFRGGDGMAPLMGVALALAPPLAAVGAAVGVAAIVLMRRSVLRSTWGICSLLPGDAGSQPSLPVGPGTCMGVDSAGRLGPAAQSDYSPPPWTHHIHGARRRPRHRRRRPGR